MESPVYQLYNAIVTNLEEYSKRLRANEDWQAVKRDALPFVDVVEGSPYYKGLSPLMHQILQFIKTASDGFTLLQATGAGIGEGIKNKTIITKPSLRRVYEPRTHTLSQVSLPGMRSPSYRIEIGPTPQGTPQQLQEVQSEQRRVRYEPSPPTSGLRREPANTPELQNMEAGEEQEVQERKNLDPDAPGLRYQGRYPVPESPVPLPPGILRAGGVEVVRRIRHHIPGQRFIPQDIITYAGPIVAGALLNYGYYAAQQLADWLTSHPEVEAKAHEVRHVTHRQAPHHMESKVDFVPTLQPGVRVRLERPPQQRLKVVKRYTGNYKFPLGAYQYADYEKFTRNNTIKSLS